MLAAPAEASVDDRDLLAAYAKARAADTMGASAVAAEGYAAALALSPDNEVLAARAVAQAIAGGNWPVALAAARMLEKKGELSPEPRLLLLADAFRTNDWKRARPHVAAIEKDELFGFMAPVLNAWLAAGRGKGDPTAILAAVKDDQLAAGYAAEHGPLLSAAAGKAEGPEQLARAVAAAGPRANRLRIAVAATLARKGRRQQALAVLEGDAPALLAARRLIEGGKDIPGDVSTPAAGVGELFARLAIELAGQKADRVALSFARLATFLAPGSSEGWLIASELSATGDRHREALALLANVRPDDPFAAQAVGLRIRILSDSGRQDLALKEAEAATRASGAAAADWTRLGDLYSSLKRHSEAADAYGQAIERLKAGGGGSEWGLWLLRGGALEQAGKWAEAKAALETAHKLSPEQPLVLNYLGYAQLTRRENIEAAMGLIAKASKLQPESAEITDSLGWAHFLLGNVPQAIELLERAAKGRPDDAEINEHLGDAYYKAGRRFEARYAWSAALLNAEADDAERLRAKIETGLTPKLASP